MKTHELKTWPEFFEAVESGEKNFELRLNDRNFAEDDVLHLREFCPGLSYDAETQTWEKERYTGRECFRRVTYVLGKVHPAIGLEEGFVILGLSEAYLRNICRECKQEFWHWQTIDVCSEMCWRDGIRKAGASPK